MWLLELGRGPWLQIPRTHGKNHRKSIEKHEQKWETSLAMERDRKTYGFRVKILLMETIHETMGKLEQTMGHVP